MGNSCSWSPEMAGQLASREAAAVPAADAPELSASITPKGRLDLSCVQIIGAGSCVNDRTYFVFVGVRAVRSMLPLLRACI